MNGWHGVTFVWLMVALSFLIDLRLDRLEARLDTIEAQLKVKP